MGLEIERKYRVVSLNDVNLPEGVAIDQAYLADGENTVRVRVRNQRAFLTIKTAHEEEAPETASTAVVCEEFEYEIPYEDGLKLLRATPHRLKKTRYDLAHGIELDVFHGPHEGLIMAEFESEDGSQAPAIPGIEWVEVSHDKRYSNAWMARHGIPPLES